MAFDRRNFPLGRCTPAGRSARVDRSSEPLRPAEERLRGQRGDAARAAHGLSDSERSFLRAQSLDSAHAGREAMEADDRRRSGPARDVIDRRSEALQQPIVPGVQWRYGAVGNAKWSGVRLRDVLEHAGVKIRQSISICSAAMIRRGKFYRFTAASRWRRRCQMRSSRGR